MKSMVILGLLAGAVGVYAQQADIDKALLAAPAQMKDMATVIKWHADGTYDTLKKGTNKLVCFDKSGMPTMPPFMVECTALGNMDREAQNVKIEALTDKAKVQAAFDAAEKDGTRVKPEFGSMWIHLMGARQEQARRHLTIAVPGATGKSLGLPEAGTAGDVWVMNAGTTTAHLMIPGN